MSRRPEVAWFAALCDDDYEFLGVPEPRLLASWEHCRDIALSAEAGGFDNLLLPSGYALGIDSVAFAAAVSPLLRRMQLLLAVRMGEMWPPQLARQLATVDQILGGRLTVNIISSSLPGESLAPAARYQRTSEIMHVVRSLLNGERVRFHGSYFDLELDPPRLRPAGGCPPFYFGGLSPNAREVAAQAADVFLMWPDTMQGVATTIEDMRNRATRHGRQLRFGYRAHVIVRPSEIDARIAAERLLSQLDAETGAQIRAHSLDTSSAGNARQAELRKQADADGLLSPTCGPESARLAQAPARQSSAIPARCSQSCAATWSSASNPSSSQAIPTRPKAICSPATCCHIWITDRCSAAPDKPITCRSRRDRSPLGTG